PPAPPRAQPPRPPPPKTATPAKPPPIPPRPAPTGVVPAIASPSPNERNRLHGGKFARRRTQGVGVDHGSMRAPADHCTHDRERRGQCQPEFAHCDLPFQDTPRWAASTA